MSVNSRHKATNIIGKRKAFYRRRIPESSCKRKETVDILVTSRNDDRKIMQSVRITSTQPLRISGTSSTSSDENLISNTYRKDLTWPHFDDSQGFKRGSQ